MSRTDLLALTLAGPTWYKPVLDPLAVHQLTIDVLSSKMLSGNEMPNVLLQFQKIKLSFTVIFPAFLLLLPFPPIAEANFFPFV